MYMHDYKKRKNYIIACTFTFLICFIIQVALNGFSIICRSLPDELGAMYLASFLAGNRWQYVMTHPANYYGSFLTPFLYPFFILIKDPIILYQCLLGVGAFLRTIPVVLCFYMLVNYYHIKNTKLVVLISAASCFFTATRATNIDNEPGLILCCWLIVFLIISLQMSPKKRELKSIFLA